MIKKLSVSLFALALVVGALAPAQAQDTVALYGSVGGGALSRAITTPVGGTFDLHVITKLANLSSAAEFVLEDDVVVTFPTVFRLSIVRINNTTLDLGQNSLGEYLIAYGICAGPGEQEVVQITYGDFGGAITSDVVIGLRGFQPGDTRPSSFSGQMGYVDCVQIKIPMFPEPWDVEATGIDPTKLPGITTGAGACVLNADVVSNEFSSVGTLKGRF